jgi:hypothetical protein
VNLDRRASALELAEGILDDLELNRVEVEAVLMKCLRLARLLGDEALQRWMRLELHGYVGADANAETTANAAGRSYVVTENGQQRVYYWTPSLPSLQQQVTEDRLQLSLQKLPEDLSYSYSRGARTSPFDLDQPNLTLQIVQSIQGKQQQLANEIASMTKAIVAVKAAIYDYVTRILHELRYSGYVASALDDVRQLVDGRLKDIAPETLRKFSAAFDSGLSDNPEHWSQALTSCRRILVALADAVFPAQDRDYVDRSGQPRKVGRDQYRNRLHAFVSEHASATAAKLLSAKIDALDAECQKGVHDVVNGNEVRMALTTTYLLVGEILALCPPGFTLAAPASDGESVATHP